MFVCLLTCSLKKVELTVHRLNSGTKHCTTHASKNHLRSVKSNFIYCLEENFFSATICLILLFLFFPSLRRFVFLSIFLFFFFLFFLSSPNDRSFINNYSLKYRIPWLIVSVNRVTMRVPMTIVVGLCLLLAVVHSTAAARHPGSAEYLTAVRSSDFPYSSFFLHVCFSIFLFWFFSLSTCLFRSMPSRTISYSTNNGRSK